MQISMKTENSTEKRCDWCSDDPLYEEYHDLVWGRPVSDSKDLFAKLCLDGQQAGLSWITILRKQADYYRNFANFEPAQVARFDATRIDALLQDRTIIRNRLKLEAIVKNARAYLRMQESGESFGPFLWSFVGHRPIINAWPRIEDVPVSNEQSQAMSKALKRRGFSFVGPTICYAFMQATGLIMDHLTTCHCYEACRAKAEQFDPG